MENIFAHMEFMKGVPQSEELKRALEGMTGTDAAQTEKKVTREDFRKAGREVVEDMAKDDKLEGMAAFVVPLTGMMFADKMEEKLFGKEEA